MKRFVFIKHTIFFLGVLLSADLTYAGRPLWTLTPLTATNISVPTNSTATIQYQVTNQSKRTHTLSMQPIQGITQDTASGNCPNPFTLGYEQSCTLSLTVDGSALAGNVVGGPIVCQQGDALQCYQSSQATSLNITKTRALEETTLTVSATNLALSVTGLTEFGVSGTPSSGSPRTITITNTGSYSAISVAYTTSTLPNGTIINPTSCGTIAPSDTCVLTISPGDAPSTEPGDINPTPISILISGTNTNTVTPRISILTYGSVYQGGYVFAFDDTTPTNRSVGGKVVTMVDQANSIIWSSNGTTGSAGASYDVIPGIDETSTSVAGSPTTTTFTSFFSTTYTNLYPFQATSFSRCNGALDGFCNTQNIMTFYNRLITNNTTANGGTSPYTAILAQTNRTYFAAGLCQQTISGYSNWSLPAICEMGYGSSACGSLSTPTLQNIQSSLVDFDNLNLLSGSYWSSTEDASLPSSSGWVQYFSASGNSDQFIDTKLNVTGIRCSRAMTY